MMRGLEGLTGGWTQKGLLEPQVPQGERNKKNTYLHIKQVEGERMTAGQTLGREGGSFHPVDGPASGQAKNSNVAYCCLKMKWPKKAQRMLEDYPKARNYFVRAQGISPQDPDISKELMSLDHQGSEWDNIKSTHHLPKVAGRRALSGNCPVYLFGHYQTKQADSDPHCDELKGRLQLLLQEMTVEDKSPSDKAKYSIVDV